MSRTMQAMAIWALSPTAPAIAATLLLAAAESAAAQEPDARTDAGGGRSAAYYAQCLLDWDAGTHMTKQEWSNSCRSLARERFYFVMSPQRAHGQP
jgi:hypothetical protein